MEKIITFSKIDNNGKSTACFCYIYENKVIIKSYNEKYDSVQFSYWTDYNSEISLHQYIYDYFELPGIKPHYRMVNLEEGTNNIGKYYPRIYRKGLNQINDTLNKKFEEFDIKNLNQCVINAQILLRRLKILFETVKFDKKNYKTFGHEIRNILLLASMDVEASWTGILKANNYKYDKKLTTKDYVKLNKVMYLSKYKVTFNLYPTIPPISPFKDRSINKPTQSIFRYENYNNTKHDREKFEEVATLISAVNAVCASLIMIKAQFGPEQSFWKDSEFSEITVEQPIYRLTDYYIPLHPYELWNWEFSEFPFDN